MLWSRRLVAALVLVALGVYLLYIAVLQTHVPAPLFEDWRWYGDGPARLLAGQPLYDPVYLHGPYDQSDPGIIGKFNQWPALAVALVPFQALVPRTMQPLAWGVVMAAMLFAAFALVWPRTTLVTGAALVLLVAAATPTWLAFRTANLACAIALGVALTIVGQRRHSTGLVAIGLLLAGVAKLLPAVPLVLWLLVRHRQWRPVAVALAAGAVLTAVAVYLQGMSIVSDFVMTSAGQLPLAEWTNVAPAYLLTPLLGDLALPLSVAVAIGLTVAALLPGRSDGASLLMLTTASCLVFWTTHLFWWLSPMIVVLAFYGDALARLLGRLFDWHPVAPSSEGQVAGANVT
jgi:hypothetical protein